MMVTQGAERPPNAAPGDLELVRRFVNTLDLESGEDALASPDGLAAWLVAQGLLEPPAHVDASQVARAAAVREALRDLLLAGNEGSHPPAHALDVLNEAGGRARLAVALLPDGSSRLEPADAGVDAAVGRLLAIVHTAVVEGTWPRLKACRNDACRWAFYDHSRNRSGLWCSMEVCGSRAKARRYRQRRSGGVGHDHA